MPWGAGQGSLGLGTGFAFTDLGFSFLFPVDLKRAGFANPVGRELDLGLRTLSPEFLRAFDSTVDLFDRGFHEGGGNREATASVFVVRGRPKPAR